MMMLYILVVWMEHMKPVCNESCWLMHREDWCWGMQWMDMRQRLDCVGTGEAPQAPLDTLSLTLQRQNNGNAASKWFDLLK